MSSGPGRRLLPYGLWAVLLLSCASQARAETSLKTALGQLVEAYAHAIAVNNPELALAYFHPGSPNRARVEAELRDQLAWCFERAETVSMDPFPPDDGEAVSVLVGQRVVRVVGMKFIRARRDTVFAFRKQHDAWRIWDIRSTSDRR